MAADAPQAASCPPHRWLIETLRESSGSVESWTCSQCGETRTLDRRKLDTRPPWLITKTPRGAKQPG